jgi:hypothetical protein
VKRLIHLVRGRVTYANVTSTLALVVAMATGGAYAAHQLDGADIKDGSITGSKIKAGTITSADIANGTIRGMDIHADTITGSALKQDSITSSNLAAGSVTAAALHAGAVGSSAIKNGAVGPSAIARHAINSGDLAVGAVDSSAVMDGSIAETDLSEAVKQAHINGIDSLACEREMLLGSPPAYAESFGTIDTVFDSGGFAKLFCETPLDPDSFEPNNTMDTATSVSAGMPGTNVTYMPGSFTVTGTTPIETDHHLSLDTANDVDWYSYTVPADTTTPISVALVPSQVAGPEFVPTFQVRLNGVEVGSSSPYQTDQCCTDSCWTATTNSATGDDFLFEVKGTSSAYYTLTISTGQGTRAGC